MHNVHSQPAISVEDLPEVGTDKGGITGFSGCELDHYEDVYYRRGSSSDLGGQLGTCAMRVESDRMIHGRLRLEARRPRL